MDDHHDDWLQAARQGQPVAFRRLVDTHARPLFKLCARITRDPVLAEDAVQEAFCKAWRGLSGFDGRASFTTWLHRIAVNAALEQLRRNVRHRREDSKQADDDDSPFLDAVEDEAPDPVRHAESAELRCRIEAGMAQLSVTERAAFVMRHCEGESLDAIGTTLSLNTGQSKQAIFRAVRKLRHALQSTRST